MALLFDRNLIDFLQRPGEPLWDYGAIAFLRDFPSSQDLAYYDCGVILAHASFTP